MTPRERIAAAMRELRGVKAERVGDIEVRAYHLAWVAQMIVATRGAHTPARFKRKGSPQARQELREFSVSARDFVMKLAALSADARTSLDEAIAEYNSAAPKRDVPNSFLMHDMVAPLAVAGPIDKGAVGRLKQKPAPPAKRSASAGRIIAALAARAYEHLTGLPTGRGKDLVSFVAAVFKAVGCVDSPASCLREVAECVARGGDPIAEFGPGAVAVSVAKTAPEN